MVTRKRKCFSLNALWLNCILVLQIFAGKNAENYPVWFCSRGHRKNFFCSLFMCQHFEDVTLEFYV